MRRSVAVLMGGRSSEHEVSLASADAIVGALDPERYEVTPVLIGADGVWSAGGEPVMLAPGPHGRCELLDRHGGPGRTVDVVFPALHGPFGEDGTVQGLCEMAGVAYVGAGVAASALAMDKALFKTIMREADVPTAPGIVVEVAEWRGGPREVFDRVQAEVGYPAFCKPARLGSSVGISPVPSRDELAGALELALAHDPKALVERAIEGREVEVGLLGNEQLVISPVGEITYDAAWYDYATKYEPGRMRLVVPAGISEGAAQRTRRLAEEAFRAVDCAGMARVDFFVTPTDEVIVSELNTIPGFTPTSVYSSLMAAGGVGYGEVIERLVELGVERLEAAEAFRN